MKKFLIAVLAGTCLAASCKKEGSPVPPDKETPEKVVYSLNQFCMGADLSYVNEVEDFGGVYKDSGAVKDPFVIFKNHGANLVRVRLWHHPQWQASVKGGRMYSDLNDVVKTIGRAKAAGMAVSLDLHYSDDWADPAKQEMPAAWQGLSLEVLKDSVYQYTLNVLNHLKSRNLTPEMIQIGNETNQGMLFPVGKVENNNWVPFGELIQSGVRAVRDFSATSSTKPQVILHVAKLTDADWFADNLTTKGSVTDFDVLGISHYYIWSTVKSMDEVKTLIRNLRTKYGKKVMIVETAYPWTSQGNDDYNNIISGSEPLADYPVSKEGQLKYLKDLTQSVMDGGGSGVIYWEPAWISSSLKDRWGTGSSWENNTFFDFSGNTLPGIDFMTYSYAF
jgi:arabinogalactan endo-1,4-beta-galactosidase